MKRIKLFGISIFLLAGISACTDDLNTEPKVELSLEQLLQQDPNAIEGIMSKLYGSFALSGPKGPGSSDISDDPGESPFLRGISNLQDFTANGMKNLVFHFMVQVIIKKRMTQKMMTLVTCQKQLRFHSTQSSFIIHRKKQHFGLA